MTFERLLRQHREICLPARSSATSDSVAVAAGTRDADGTGTRRRQRPALRPGDAIGVSLLSGDLQIGATGTVTEVDGNRVYAFGHPFYGLGPTQFPMTRANVITVLPSLSSSSKIAAPGAVIGTIQQDRATTIAGTLGDGPALIPLTINLKSERGTRKTFTMGMVSDQLLTPLLAYSAIHDVLTSYERQNGTASYAIRGTATVKKYGAISFEDLFTGDQPSAAASAYVVAPINFVLRNSFEDVDLEAVTLEVDASEQPRSATLERAWIDGTRPKPGSTVTLKVLLRTYRGEQVTKSVPVQIPPNARGSVSMMVSDGTRLTQWENARAAGAAGPDARAAADDARPQRRAEEQPSLRAAGHARRRRRRQGRIAGRAAAVGPGRARGGSRRRQLPTAAECAARRMGNLDRLRRLGLPNAGHSASGLSARRYAVHTYASNSASRLPRCCFPSPASRPTPHCPRSGRYPPRPSSSAASSRTSRIDSFGRLTLGPAATPLSRVERAVPLDAARGALTARIYAGTGNDGQVYKIDASGKAVGVLRCRGARGARTRRGAERRPLRRRPRRTARSTASMPPAKSTVFFDPAGQVHLEPRRRSQRESSLRPPATRA